MKLFKSINLILILLAWTNICLAQSELQFVNIGDFRTTNGDIIKDCKIGYRTVGKLKADRSNVVLWPTWFTGTSEQVISNEFTNSLIDTTGLFIIIVDALTNGVSSSPSNTPEFPTISIRDMVNSQHSLLVNYLNIDHLYAVMGYSMGGMQTFEWVVSYPEFMEKAIPIAGTPKLSSYNLLMYQTMIDLMEEAGLDKQKLGFAYKRAHNIFLMNISTPEFMTNSYSPDNLEDYLNDEYARLMKPDDYLGGLKAVITHDIYKNANSNPEDIKNIIQADMLVISATQDHAVNPVASIKLSKTLNCQLVTLLSNCGHLAVGCEAEKVKKAITTFLKH